MKKTKKNFRLTLDQWYNGTIYKNNIYGQRKRGYGSYLYAQDKTMFDILYDKWSPTDTKLEFESK